MPPEDETHYPSARVLYRPGLYEMRLETWSYGDSGNQVTFVHNNVFRWSPTTLRLMKADWAKWRPLYQDLLFVRAPRDDFKLARYLHSYFDFRFVDYDSGGYAVYVSTP